MSESTIAGLEVVSYESEIDAATVVEINYSGHLRVIVGEGTVFDADTETPRDVTSERRVDLIESITADEWAAIAEFAIHPDLDPRVEEIALLTREIEER